MIFCIQLFKALWVDVQSHCDPHILAVHRNFTKLDLDSIWIGAAFGAVWLCTIQPIPALF
jgi:hypothetical protein